MIVVDASCILEVLLRGPRAATIEARLLEHTGSLCAPQLLDIEVSHVLRRYALAGELTAARGREAVADLAAFPIERFPQTELLGRIWQMRENFSAYDAAYLSLAEALDATFITCDRRLARPTGCRAKVELF